ncbi:MAG: hypothetical protein JJ863_37355 [Deltaproteobacteria bacterium]|nr:hypothetical protein [Deltaproteobacteria bacterium]
MTRVAALVLTLAASLTARADEGPARAREWLIPETPAARGGIDVEGAALPGSSGWGFVDLEADDPSGFMARAELGKELWRAEHSLRTFGTLALGWRWKRPFETGVTAVMVNEPTTDPAAGGAGFYLGAGRPEGVRANLILANVFGGYTQSIVLGYELQLPILVRPRVRIALRGRGFFASPGPHTSVHRVSLQCLIDQRWALQAGAVFDRRPLDVLDPVQARGLLVGLGTRIR